MSNASSPRLLALHGLRLKGIAEADDLAEYMLVDPAPIREVLTELEAQDLVAYRHGRIPGYLHTPEGRATGARLVAQELDAFGVGDRIRQLYGEFLGFNRELLALCTRWQLRTVDGEQTVNRHDDADHDRAVIDDLVALDARLHPVLDDLVETLERFAGHRQRLRNALDHVLAGEHHYFTKPMFPSYHSVWFELHEDLLATLGTDRNSEGGS